MKDSCSSGTTIYAINGKIVTIYDIETGHYQKHVFDTVSDAINYYEQMAMPNLWKVEE